MEKLVSLLGKPYMPFDDENNYIGCFEPIYILHPDTLKFPLPKARGALFDFALDNLSLQFDEVDPIDLKTGDILVFEF